MQFSFLIIKEKKNNNLCHLFSKKKTLKKQFLRALNCTLLATKWMVNSRRMKAAEGLNKRSPHLHGNARGNEGFCPIGRDSCHSPLSSPDISTLFAQDVVGKWTRLTCIPCGVSFTVTIILTQSWQLKVIIIKESSAGMDSIAKMYRIPDKRPFHGFYIWTGLIDSVWVHVM